MRTKAVKDFYKLSRDEFLERVAEGLKLCVENAERLFNDCVALAKENRLISAGILYDYAREEAAKFMILFDAVRCPDSHSNLLEGHLKLFYNHRYLLDI